MIRVRYTPEKFRILVEGHAGSAEKGRDLVCAAVSTLVLTLAENVARMKKAGWLEGHAVEIMAGKARIQCLPREEWKGASEVVFGAVFAGLELLGERWPEFVRVETVAGG